MKKSFSRFTLVFISFAFVFISFLTFAPTRAQAACQFSSWGAWPWQGVMPGDTTSINWSLSGCAIGFGETVDFQNGPYTTKDVSSPIYVTNSGGNEYYSLILYTGCGDPQDRNSCTGMDVKNLAVQGNRGPVVDAGAPQSISTSNVTATLSGSANDSDGFVGNHSWTNISGPSGVSIASPGSYSTGVTGMNQAGTYTFRLTATDNRGVQGFSDVDITVSPQTNNLPTARAGSDQVITLPANSTSLSGSSSTDSDGTIVSYTWGQISGGSQVFFSNQNNVNTTVSNMNTADTYTFRLTVVDNGTPSATDYDDVTITVLPPPTPSSPDLVGGGTVATPAPGSGALYYGESVAFSAQITNNGSTSTGGGFSNYFEVTLQNGQPFDTFTAGGMSALASGGSSTASTSYVFSGSNTQFYRGRVCADGGGSINETNEGNNCGPWTDFGVYPKGVDMFAEINPETATANTPKTLTALARATNGSIDIPTTARIFVATSTNGGGSITTSTHSIPPGVSDYFSRPFSTTLTFATGGVYSYRACVDINNEIVEGDENNNCTNWEDITIAQPATTGTLTPLNPTCSIALNASSCNVTLNWTVTNPVGPSQITASGMSNFAASNSGGSQAFAVPYSSRIFYLYNNSAQLAQSNATASCTTGTTWNGTLCAAVPPPTGVDLSSGQPTQNSPLVAGTPTIFNSVIRNSGTGAVSTTFPITLKYSTSPLGTSPVTMASNALAGIGAGQSIISTSNAYTFATPGIYYLSTCADQNTAGVGVVTETDEGNNCSLWTPFTIASGPRPDLTGGTPIPNGPLEAGTPVTFSAETMNFGNAGSGTGFQNIFQVATLSDGSNATIMAQVASPALTGYYPNPNWSAVITTPPYTFATPGTYYVRSCADLNSSFVGTITESNEGNNCVAPWATYVVPARAYPDLTGGTPVPNGSPMAGVPVTFSAEMFNVGPAGTGTTFPVIFQVAHLADKSDAAVFSSVTSPALSSYPDAVRSNVVSLVTSAPYTFPTADTYYFRTCADNNASFVGVVNEGSPVAEGNNCTSPWAAYTAVTASSGIDLTADQPVPNQVLIINTPVTFSSQISNIGTNGTSATFPNLFQLSTSSTGANPMVISVNSLMGMAAGASTGSASSPYTFTTPGSYYIRTCADNDASFVGVVNENANEGNNCSFPWAPITVITNALVPTATLSAAPSSIGSGGTSTLTWSSTNATSCAGVGFSPTGISGSVVVSPLVSSTYEIRCSNASIQSAPAFASVTVNGVQPPLVNGGLKPKYVEH